jgi:hypothetical protein
MTLVDVPMKNGESAMVLVRPLWLHQYELELVRSLDEI